MSGSLTDHPVSLRLERPPRPERLHVLIRFVLLLALGALTARYPLWGILYLAAPALIALRGFRQWRPPSGGPQALVTLSLFSTAVLPFYAFASFEKKAGRDDTD